MRKLLTFLIALSSIALLLTAPSHAQTTVFSSATTASDTNNGFTIRSLITPQRRGPWTN